LFSDGLSDWNTDGWYDGNVELLYGLAVWSVVGWDVGSKDGPVDGRTVGNDEGWNVEIKVGFMDGMLEDPAVGNTVSWIYGTSDGCKLWTSEGWDDGNA